VNKKILKTADDSELQCRYPAGFATTRRCLRLLVLKDSYCKISEYFGIPTVEQYY